MPMKMTAIASGSSGNCTRVGSDECNILIDAGISARRIEKGLNENDLSLKDISALLVTHEHIDHVSGIGVISRKYGIPIYGTKETLYALKSVKSLGSIDKGLFHEIEPDGEFSIGDLSITPFSISHDALNPVAYRIESGGKSVAVATDMGTFSDYTVEHLRGLCGCLIEANHDVRMLEAGSYPYYLKRRILGERGHLSNEASGRLIDSILNDDIKCVMLGHLSRENNFPELAYETVRTEIDLSESNYTSNDFPIIVAKRESALKTVEF